VGLHCGVGGSRVLHAAPACCMRLLSNASSATQRYAVPRSDGRRPRIWWRSSAPQRTATRTCSSCREGEWSTVSGSAPWERTKTIRLSPARGIRRKRRRD
jgi:hypothetical protein